MNNSNCPQLHYGQIHFYSRQALIIFFFVCLSVLVGCVSKKGPTEPLPERTNISVNDDLSKVTIIANDVSRFHILEYLRKQHQIEIRPHDLADEAISVQIKEVPLKIAVARLLPKGTRYVLRLGDREVTVPAQPPQKAKTKKGKPESKPEGLPTKDKSRPLPDDQRVKIKIKPENWREPAPRVGKNLKPVAANITEIPQGKGAKVPKKTVTAQRIGRLDFVITAPDRIRLVKAAMVEGGLRISRIVRGPYLFALRDANGDILHFGSFPDPLELHNYRDDGTHGFGRAEEGSFGIWIPGDLFSEERLASLTLEFYDARQVALPPILSKESVIKLLREAKKMAPLEGKTLYESFKEGMR